MSFTWNQETSYETLEVFLYATRPSELKKGQTIVVGTGREVETTIDPQILGKARAMLAKATREIQATEKERRASKREEMLNKREQIQSDCREKLKQLAQSAGLNRGKWMIFYPRKTVSGLFKNLAESLIDGPLSKLENAKCHHLKVYNEFGGSQEGKIIEVYFDDVWNEGHAKEVLKCLFDHRGHTAICKPEIFQAIGLHQHHPSKINSTIYFAKSMKPQIETEELQKEAERMRRVDSGFENAMKLEEEYVKEEGDWNEDQVEMDEDEDEEAYNKWKATLLTPAVPAPPVQAEIKSEVAQKESSTKEVKLEVEAKKRILKEASNSKKPKGKRGLDEMNEGDAENDMDDRASKKIKDKKDSGDNERIVRTSQRVVEAVAKKKET